MRLVGLTGSLGAGKSTVSHILSDLGAHLIDADHLAREAVQKGSPALMKIAQIFGESFLDEEGQLNRQALAEEVFPDPKKVKILNGIIHPEVRRLKELAYEQIEAKSPQDTLVYMVPLLFETGMEKDFQKIILISIEKKVQIQRLREGRNFTLEQIEARLKNQLPQEEKIQLADFVIDNSGSFAQTTAQMQQIWPLILALPPLAVAPWKR